MKNFILASSSPRRKEILKLVLDDFRIISPNIQEDYEYEENFTDPVDFVKNLAIKKAQKVKNFLLENENLDDETYIIACDTIIFANNKIIGKPKNELDANRILELLSNKEHQVYTGFSIISKLSKNKKILNADYSLTKIFMTDLNIYKEYLIKNHSDKAGSYAIQDKIAYKFIKNISGSFLNVVGLPEKCLKYILNIKNGKKPLPYINQMRDEFFMRKVFDLAILGEEKVFPNPLVGAIIIDENNNILGQGYHKKFGENHAEVNAINSVKNKNDLKNATLFVNLEPCCHYGKTPPCTNLIIKSNIKNVVISNIDKNEKVAGKGIKILEKNGINVKVGILENLGKTLNKKFFDLFK